MREFFIILFIFILPDFALGKVEIDEYNFPDLYFRYYLANQEYGEDGIITNDEIKAITIISVGSKGIKTLKGIEFFPNLVELNCYGNQLVELDVTQNIALVSLDCSYNKITNLDFSKNNALVSLKCSWNELSNIDVSNNQLIKSIDCSQNHLDALDVSKCNGLRELYCHGNDLVKLDISKNLYLESLDCGDNHIDSLGLHQNKELTFVDCSYNQLLSLDVSDNSKLDLLHCEQNHITEFEMDALIASLPTQENASVFVFKNDNDNNCITRSHAEIAKSKGWFVYCFVGNTWDKYLNDELDVRSKGLPQLFYGPCNK